MVLRASGNYPAYIALKNSIYCRFLFGLLELYPYFDKPVKYTPRNVHICDYILYNSLDRNMTFKGIFLLPQLFVVICSYP